MTILLTPIGSCRITNPLKKSAQKYQFELNMSRVYGYTHTSAEALQQLKYLQGDFKPSKEVLPILCRSATTEVNNLTHSPSDLYFVEISSSKILMVEDEFVQLNYVSLYFSDFFADKVRTRKFWSLAKPGHAAELSAYLQTEPIFMSYPKDKQYLLSHLIARPTTIDELKHDMSEIISRVKDVVFVTHSNVRLPDESYLQTRLSLIHEIELVGQELGAKIFNPTRLMNDFSQELAMEKNGLDLTHYTPAFEQKLYSAWHELFVEQLQTTESSITPVTPCVEAVESITDINALYESYQKGDFKQVLREIYAHLRETPNQVDVRELLGRILYDLGDYEGSINHLNQLSKASKISDECRLILINSHFHLKQYKELLLNAELWFAEERQDNQVLYMCALSSSVLSDFKNAIRYWDQLYQTESYKLEAAVSLSSIYEKVGDFEMAVFWLDKALLLSPHDLKLMKVLNRVHAGIANENGFDKLIQGLSEVDADETLLAIKNALNHDFVLSAAMGLIKVQTHWPEHQGVKQIIADFSISLSTRINDKKLRSKETDRWIAVLKALLTIQPRNVTAIRLRRDFIVKRRENLRDSYKDNNFDDAIAAGRQIVMLDPALPGIHYSVSRAYYMNEAYQKALEWSILATALEDNNQAAWTVRYRAAVKNDDYLEALSSLNIIKSQFNQDNTIQASEVNNNLNQLLSRAAKHVRVLIEQDNVEQAWLLNSKVLLEAPNLEFATKMTNVIIRRLLEKLRETPEDDFEQKVEIAHSILDKERANVQALRVLAVDSMRKKRFEEALMYWQRLIGLSPEVESFQWQIDKCKLLATGK